LKARFSSRNFAKEYKIYFAAVEYKIYFAAVECKIYFAFICFQTTDNNLFIRFFQKIKAQIITVDSITLINGEFRVAKPTLQDNKTSLLIAPLFEDGLWEQ
jgi:hypothetical protein